MMTQKNQQFLAVLAELGREFEKKLAAYLLPYKPVSERLAAAMRYATLGGGKRIRPFLVIESAKLFKVNAENYWPVAIAVELVHCYSLVHDDLPAMDDDTWRRGRYTTHRQFDEATAILTGDALLTRAFEILASATTHAEATVRCDLIQALAASAGADGMVGGQMLDLSGEQGFDKSASPNYITQLQKLKTGRLIDFAVEAGAILGQANHAEKQALLRYSADVGLAYQIADDLLDVEGTLETTGKAVGKDSAAGKTTFVTLYGVEKARQQATDLVDQACDHLCIFGAPANNLRAFAQFVVERKA